ncbi:4-(cytidine 5'-diphospho)-2-C-methyl-D-erythritol kinase [Dokdonella sp.]|uniref:4-(cytidine 5'-diphospho)-2-C-methyl-D-erythritol kinase n=1 Tax=Dokdonella sp. TaxID=2291710 RepID=UPI0031C88F06|nr:4-(cytidine 5'-diphospho)-2-C-methyl-D-erythritol kinase [Dokdonella sp.]
MNSTGADGWSEWPAPAKLNLFLHVTGRRADGYHLLQTVYQLLDFGDTVHLRLREDGRIVRHGSLPGVAAADDLAVRAAHALQAAAACPAGVDIAVSKRIPQGGLGGGSSDAATVLRALNVLWQAGASEDELAALGLQLGADVPVFVRGHSAWAEGVGECLTPLALAPAWFVVIDPGARVATADLFAAPELTRDVPQMTIPLFVSGGSMRNVFEPVARARHSEVAAALDWLGAFGRARLSGSGGCVFAGFDSRAPAEAIAAQSPPGMRAFVARGVDESPLLERLRARVGA